jgi:hypothetical protein
MPTPHRMDDIAPHNDYQGHDRRVTV